MNILIIPSWYPTVHDPIRGVFFREQVFILAKNFPQHRFCISLWGSHEPALLLTKFKLLRRIFGKYKTLKNVVSIQKKITENCFVYYSPAYTWSRHLLGGNIKNIVCANLKNATLFQSEFGAVNLILAYVGYPAGYIALQLSPKLNCPYVISEHMGPFPLPSLHNIWGKPMPQLKLAYQNAKQILVVSQSLQIDMKRKFGLESIIIPNFIDDTLFCPSKNPPQKTILFIGRAVKSKGLEILIKAFSQSNAYLRGFKLQIVGEGQLYQKYRQKGFKDIIFEGEISNRQIPEIIRKAAFLVLPSYHESFGLVLLEAIACGRPILATQCGAPEDIVNDHNGKLTKVGDLADLTQKLNWMMENYLSYDAETIRSDFSNRFGTKNTAKMMMDALEKLSPSASAQNIA